MLNQIYTTCGFPAVVINYYALISIPSLPSSLRILAMIPSTSDVSSVLSLARNVIV